MLSFIQACACGRSFLTAAWAIIGFTSILVLFVRFGRTGKIEPVLLITALLLNVCPVLLMAANRSEIKNIPADGLVSFFGNLPFALYILIAVLSAVFCAAELKKEIKLYQNIITPGSVREAINDLPEGLSFSETDGRPVLVNHCMYELAQELTGQPLQNCAEFWQRLEDGTEHETVKRMREGGNPVFVLRGGSVWSFVKTDIVIGGKVYNQITASDITKQHELSLALKENNKLLQDQHKRLRELLANIEQQKREEEILASKVRIHGELGRCVLTTRLILSEGCCDEKTAAAAGLWQDVIEKMRAGFSGQQSEENNTKARLEEAAAAMGCKIEFSGNLPDDEEASYLILTAAREAVTNAVRHAGADRVTVEITETEMEYSAVIYDNGFPKTVSVKAGGGLDGLRQKIERAGGELEVKCENGVRLCVRLIKQKGIL
ncbi:MAG: sensor histidine kinase [Candidatus Ornithomonoglobus sp.]